MEDPQAWPLQVAFNLVSKNDRGFIEIRPGVNTLVGPNGAGKTRALRAIKAALEGAPSIVARGRRTHFLAAGRCSPLEQFRAALNYPGQDNFDNAAIGQINHLQNWWRLESVTGILLTLDHRADLRLKIEARLQQLFDRSVSLTWTQSGLGIAISSMTGGASYAANHEASGILQLVALLAAIHNDEISALLIDEPEISLHPQHQAFLLEEMERVAGDPADPTKKVIVIATHSPSLLPLRSVSDLPAIAFFNSARLPPAQIKADDAILARRKLAAMVVRLGTTHRIAMFAERVLLVEGPSDEIIATQLARRFDQRLLARNAQILPVIGKGEFPEVSKLLRQINKKVAVLADLDALADDNTLVRHFSDLPEGTAIAERLGRKTVAELDSALRNELAAFIEKHSKSVSAAAETYKNWSSKEAATLAPRRVALAQLLTSPESFGPMAAKEATGLKTKFDLLLGALADLGCFFLRRGAIENYYLPSMDDGAKPERAAEEAAGFDMREADDLARNFADILSPIARIAPNLRVDEDLLLRPKVGAALTAAFLGMTRESTDAQLNALTRLTIGTAAEVISLTNRSDEKNGLRIQVQMVSPLFKRESFPFEIGRDENPATVVERKLPGIKKE